MYCDWCHCRDNAGRRTLVVVSAGLQLVAVTALYEPRNPLCAIDALRGVWFLYPLDLPRTLEVCHPC